MSQKYTIHLNETAIIFTNLAPESDEGVYVADKQNFKFDIIKLIASKKAKVSAIYIVDENPKKTFKWFTEVFKVVKAAGGMVFDEEHRCLFMLRKGKWDLPKGKIEVGEKKKKAAVREVEEECGIEVDKLHHKLMNTYHLYQQSGKFLLKKTYWYTMSATNKQKTKPQVEEGITDVKWMAKEDLFQVLVNTYPSVRKLIATWK